MKRQRKKKGLQKAIIFIAIISITIITALALRHSSVEEDVETQEKHIKVVNNLEKKVKNYEKEWNLILVNGSNPIPKGYSFEKIVLKNKFEVDKRIYPKLQEMFDYAKSQGIYPEIVSAYRTNDEQKELFTNKITKYKNEGYSEEEATQLTLGWVALPGTSEHQVGLALDINADASMNTNDEVYSWLYENSYKYGFIMRYAEDKIDKTGIQYEPWHYRYVGIEHAKYIYENKICLEEYIEYLDNKSEN